jgi:RNA-directed DNA polymerase
MVVKQVLESQLEPIFDQDSYGYRLGKSAHQAVESCRKRCWTYDWGWISISRGFQLNLTLDYP